MMNVEGQFNSESLLRWYLSGFSDSASNTDPVIVHATRNVQSLLERDYSVVAVKQDLCPSYPPVLFVLNGAPLTYDDFSSASHARARTRFVVPVLEVLGKRVCRSATLSVSGEAALNAVTSFFFSNSPKVSRTPQRESSMVGRNRQADLELLHKLDVSTVFDLMKETKKKKYGVVVASSEKADSMNRYKHLNLCGVPFPGTEGFVAFSDKCDCSAVPVFGSEGEDAIAFFHEGCFLASVDWTKWTKWSVRELTVNYLRVMMGQLGSSEKKGGVLIHCLSGWDRTPLFVFLLRSLAWAENLAHKSLGVEEMLYLTLAYDWMLFRHRLADRMARREEVMYFAFYALMFCAIDDTIRFSETSNAVLRKERLLGLQAAFVSMWNKIIPR